MCSSTKLEFWVFYVTSTYTTADNAGAHVCKTVHLYDVPLAVYTNHSLLWTKVKILFLRLNCFDVLFLMF